MSFRCSDCGEPQPPRTRPNRVVVETREVSYKSKRGGYEGVGREIAKEVVVCPNCVKERMPNGDDHSDTD